EPECIQRKPGRKVERGLHVLDRLVRIANREEPVHDLNARSFGVHDRDVHLRQRLLFFQPVEYLLAAALDAEHDGAAVGLGHCRPREVCIVVNRFMERTAGTSSGMDSTKSRGRLSRSGNGHWSRCRSMVRLGLLTTCPSFVQVSPPTSCGSSRRSRRSRTSCSPSPRQTKSTSEHCSLTSDALRLTKTPPKASFTSGLVARI